MGLDRGHLSFLMRPDQAMRPIALRDIGHVAAAVFGSPCASRTMEIAGDALTGRAWPSSHPGRGSADQLQPPADANLLAQDEVLGALAALVDDSGPTGNADLDVLRAEFPFLLRLDRQLPRPVAGLG